MSGAGKKVVIVGGGHAGCELASALRECGFAGRIDLISDDLYLPYHRPPLSKDYLKRTTGPLLLRPEGYYVANQINLHLDTRAESIDRSAKTVSLSRGSTLQYDYLVLATGAQNNKPNIPGVDGLRVLELRTLTDADRIANLLGAWKKVVIIGGGFIGLEAASLLSALNVAVEVVELEPRLMQRAVSSNISKWFLRFHRSKKVGIHLSRRVIEIHHVLDGASVLLDNGERINGDAIILAAGIRPNTMLAGTASLEIDNGVVVDAQLRTKDPSIFAIGDCASYPSKHLAKVTRLESVQNASDHARTLAKILTGENLIYDALPWFWSVQGDCRLQIAGLIRPGLEEVVRGNQEENSFSVFHLAGNRLIAAESINAPADHMISRRLITNFTDIPIASLSDPDFNLRSLIT